VGYRRRFHPINQLIHSDEWGHPITHPTLKIGWKGMQWACCFARDVHDPLQAHRFANIVHMGVILQPSNTLMCNCIQLEFKGFLLL
jgi:hypothetical protein